MDFDTSLIDFCIACLSKTSMCIVDTSIVLDTTPGAPTLLLLPRIRGYLSFDMA